MNRTLSVTVPNRPQDGASRHQRDFLFEIDRDNIPNDGGGGTGVTGAASGGGPAGVRDGIVLTATSQMPSPPPGPSAAADHPSAKAGRMMMDAPPPPARFAATSSGFPQFGEHSRSLPLPKLGLSSPWFSAGKPELTFFFHFRVFFCQL